MPRIAPSEQGILALREEGRRKYTPEFADFSDSTITPLGDAELPQLARAAAITSPAICAQPPQQPFAVPALQFDVPRPAEPSAQPPAGHASPLVVPFVRLPAGPSVQPPAEHVSPPVGPFARPLAAPSVQRPAGHASLPAAPVVPFLAAPFARLASACARRRLRDPARSLDLSAAIPGLAADSPPGRDEQKASLQHQTTQRLALPILRALHLAVP